MRLSVAVWLGYSSVMRVARSRVRAVVAWMELRSLWKRRAHRGQPVGVEVDRPLAEVVAAGQRHVGLAAARQQRAEDHDRRAHGLEEVRRGDGVQCRRLGHVDRELVAARAHDGTAERLEQLHHHRDVGDVGHVGQGVLVPTPADRRPSA
jgi:hypothetical protein